MIKKRRSAAKETMGQQSAELKRGAPGRRFVGDDAQSAHAKAAERAKVHQMQVDARQAAMRAAATESEARRMDEMRRRPLWEAIGGLVLESARLATTVATLPLRIARAAALGFLPILRHA